MKTLAEFVKTKRKEVNLSQAEFAERAGVALTVIRKIEQGKGNLNLEKAINKQLSIDVPSYLETSTRSENAQGCLANDNDQNCLLNRGDFTTGKQSKLLIDPVKPPVLVNLEEYLKRSDIVAK